MCITLPYSIKVCLDFNCISYIENTRLAYLNAIGHDVDPKDKITLTESIYALNRRLEHYKKLTDTVQRLLNDQNRKLNYVNEILAERRHAEIVADTITTERERALKILLGVDDEKARKMLLLFDKAK